MSFYAKTCGRAAPAPPGGAHTRHSSLRIASLFVSIALFSHGAGSAVEKGIDFNRQVRPILAANCLKCHGADEKQRKGKLRLDERAAAMAKSAIVPGKPEESELIQRILSDDRDEVMPPPESHRSLTDQEKQILRRWITQGAEYQKHWAFIPPVEPPVPKITTAAGSHARISPIDAFVLDHLASKGLGPAPEASREIWLRRVTLDLTGLPPTLAEIDAFLADSSPLVHERVVDRLLASPAFGERMANDWLDVARYADTYGRHEDADSAVWPYRDWVIKAFNDNMPYDQFLIWQTAGDLLPNPTREQYIATAFNRLVQQSNEAGSNEEEFRQEHIADRIRTNSTAILGLAMECARCHDHKYDPVTMKDYYSMAAFFNNIDELGLFARLTAGIPAPSMLLFAPDAEKREVELRARIAAVEKEFAALRESSRARFAAWAKKNGLPAPARPDARYEFESVGAKKKGDRKFIEDVLHPGRNRGQSKITPDPHPGVRGLGLMIENDNVVALDQVGSSWRRSDGFSFGFWLKPTQKQERGVLIHRSRGGLDAASRGYEVLLNDLHPEFALCHFAPGNSIRARSRTPIPLNEWSHLVFTYDGSSRAEGLKIYVNGQAVAAEVKADHLYRDIVYRREWGDFDESKLQDNVATVVQMSIGWRRNDKTVQRAVMDDLVVFDKTLAPIEARLLFHEIEAWKREQSRSWLGKLWDGIWPASSPEVNPDDWLEVWLRDGDDQGRIVLAKLHELRTAHDDLVNDAGEIMVMTEKNPPRPTFLLKRGRFDQPGEPVAAGTPAALVPMASNLPRNRLGLAQWYVDRSNPLTSRVFVNRLWQMFFGRGIVSTAEDFGVQGEMPSHPELLDWLAVDFMEHGWDVKRLCRMIALSATYRQSSIPADARLLTDDPQNRLLARGPRQRMSAEMIRDSVLALSGLLSPKMGGAPAHPWQPENLYEDSGIQAHYEPDHGEQLWRRSVYTYWKRTMPPPAMNVFDAPTREFCRVRRECTSTPLQALALMNNAEFLQALRVFAEHLVFDNPNDDDCRIERAFRQFTSRHPRPEEVAILRRMLAKERTYFTGHPSEAADLLQKNGEAPVDSSLPAAEVAATTMVARVLFSHDECQIKP